MLAGTTSYRGILTFLAVHRDRLNRIYGVRLRRARRSTRRARALFLALDPAALEAPFRRHARQLGAATGADGRHAVALDGKTLRRSFDRLHDHAAAHVLGAFATDAALILGHHEVPGVPAEVEGVHAMIRDLGLTGVVLTVDALHCQKRMACPVGKRFIDPTLAVCANVSGLGARLPAQMELRAARSS